MLQTHQISVTLRAKPFLKWAGGKSQLLPALRNHYPKQLIEGRIARYIEPFLGGGAVFFDVLQSYRVDEAHLFDVNEELILCYRVVQREPERLAAVLEERRRRFQECEEPLRVDYFYAVRFRFNERRASIDFENYSEKWIEHAADLIFLNKTCFNGLYRVNTSGMFNVPFGGYRNPIIFSEENLRLASSLLHRAVLHCGESAGSREMVTDDSFVYFDPPYRPISASSSFTSYARYGFDDAQQVQLSKYFARLDKHTGAQLMLSNSDPKNVSPHDNFFENAYAPFHIHRVAASRMINSVGHGRGKISELIITNYETGQE